MGHYRRKIFQLVVSSVQNYHATVRGSFDVRKRASLFFGLLFLVSGMLFLPGFTLFFHQDDFIHMIHSRTLGQVVWAFNLFTPGEFPFYRPIPTQVYFYFLGKLFGLQPLGYHLVNFFIYCLNTVLVWWLGLLITGKKRAGMIASMIYAINSTHAAPLFSAAYVHELLYVCFGLLTVIAYMQFLKKHLSLIPAVISFVLALMTKENAVVLPGILALVTAWHGYSRENLFPLIKQTIIRLRLFLFILALYLYGHFVHYGVATSSSYSVIISKETIKILLWYFLWALSVPNILIDFLQPGLRLSSVFFAVSGIHAAAFLIFFPLVTVCIILSIWFLLRSIHENRKVIIMVALSLLWFIAAMVPLLPFPLHHLATEQAFALTGLAVGLGALVDHTIAIPGWRRTVGYAFITTYLLHAANTILLAQKTHWIVRSSHQAERVISSLRADPPVVTPGKTLVFLDGMIKIPEYGSSRQLYEALGNGAAINIFFGESITQRYEFKDDIRQDDVSPNWIILDSSRFLGY